MSNKRKVETVRPVPNMPCQYAKYMLHYILYTVSPWQKQNTNIRNVSKLLKSTGSIFTVKKCVFDICFILIRSHKQSQNLKNDNTLPAAFKSIKI